MHIGKSMRYARFTKRILAAAIAVAMAAPARSETTLSISGKAEVEDGDTLVIAGRRIRLQGIDAPEMGQSCEDAQGRPYACGFESAWVLDGLIAGREVTCGIDARDPIDRYGRPLGLCRAGDVDLNAGMVAAGHAVAYRRYLYYRDGSARAYKPPILAAEESARATRRGLWAGRFDMPELWRRSRQGRKG